MSKRIFALLLALALLLSLCACGKEGAGKGEAPVRSGNTDAGDGSAEMVPGYISQVIELPEGCSSVRLMTIEGDKLLAVCGGMHYALVALHVRVQTAAAYERLGKHEDARAWLADALRDAEPDGLVMPFVENYGYLAPLLSREVRSGLTARIIELGEAAQRRGAGETLPAVLAALTAREVEVVRLIAQRLSNREIAEKLFLSEGSVKQYVKTIYDKLHIEGDTRTKRRRLAALMQKT